MTSFSMTGLKWWMRVVGAMYLFLFVAAAFLRLPIKAEGPEGVLARASAGDATARFVVDTWVSLGVWFGVIGAALLIASRVPQHARALAWTVIGWEAGGIAIDIYKIVRGYDPTAPIVWMVIHSVIIVVGLIILRRTRSSASAAA